ncbi:MAG: hypothetical protein EXR03_02560 [Pseudolabrys sp.]|nr:hypothetical protein [Pseudolabrys sp.]
MADRSALGAIGLMLGAATMMVMMVGAFVVTDHLTGRLQIDDGLRVMSLPSAVRRGRRKNPASAGVQSGGRSVRKPEPGLVVELGRFRTRTL